MVNTGQPPLRDCGFLNLNCLGDASKQVGSTVQQNKGSIPSGGCGAFGLNCSGQWLGQVSNGVQQTAKGGYDTLRNYAPYILGAGILIRLVVGSPSKNPGSWGGMVFLASWAMIIGGGIFTALNFNIPGILGNLPNPGATLRAAAPPVAANLAATQYYPAPALMQRQYNPIPRKIVTGTTQNGSVNPSYDRNTVFSVVGDVY